MLRLLIKRKPLVREPIMLDEVSDIVSLINNDEDCKDPGVGVAKCRLSYRRRASKGEDGSEELIELVRVAEVSLKIGVWQKGGIFIVRVQRRGS